MIFTVFYLASILFMGLCVFVFVLAIISYLIYLLIKVIAKIILYFKIKLN